jgi:hypothetical protein
LSAGKNAVQLAANAGNIIAGQVEISWSPFRFVFGALGDAAWMGVYTAKSAGEFFTHLDSLREKARAAGLRPEHDKMLKENIEDIKAHFKHIGFHGQEAWDLFKTGALRVGRGLGWDVLNATAIPKDVFDATVQLTGASVIAGGRFARFSIEGILGLILEPLGTFVEFVGNRMKVGGQHLRHDAAQLYSTEPRAQIN